MSSNLYIKDNYLNKNIPFLFNKNIIEYDMKNAGFSLIREFKQLPESVIKKLDKMEKEYRKKEIGKIARDNEEFKKIHIKSFADARELFFIANDIEDNDIIAIKKDAIFLNKKCKIERVGEYINFRPKNEYTSFIQLPKLELYYNPNTLDVKGISDDVLFLHEDYMIHFIKLFFHKMETSSDEVVIEFTKRFMDKYKRRELEVGYYREFNRQSIYRDMTNELYEEYWEENKDELNISYNFYNILVKLIQIPL